MEIIILIMIYFAIKSRGSASEEGCGSITNSSFENGGGVGKRPEFKPPVMNQLPVNNNE